MNAPLKQVSDLIKDCRFKDTNFLIEDDFRKYLDSTIFEGNIIQYLDLGPRMPHSPKMVKLSEKICQMHSLELLSLAYNELRTIPECLCTLTNLKGLYLAGNPIESKYYDLILAKLKVKSAFDLFLELLKVKITMTDLSDLNLDSKLKRDKEFEQLFEEYDFDSFPTTLKKIIEILGAKNLKILFRETDLFKPNSLGQALLENNNFPKDLPDEAIVFAMHKDHIIYFILPSQGDDPPVWYYIEGTEQNSYGNFYMAVTNLSAYFYTLVLNF
ncbi:MAG: hypothetical protein GF308_21620 [Candidatus Heimdallarchaeota archaeon]|nr:hypothetical protein [Candidatus Heimdallarchaeota archaeon]